MKSRRIFIFLVALFFFNGCSTKNYEHTQTKIIIIKSPKIKFGDVGYIRNSDDSVELELFVAGQAIEKITINHLICVRKGCMSKSSFNKDYLHESYPTDILQNILLSKPIYGGEAMVKTSDGFRQRVEDESVDISYKVTDDTSFFKDRKNKIIFKIKDTN